MAKAVNASAELFTKDAATPIDNAKSTVTVTISNDNCDKLETPMDILQQTIQLERNSTKTTNNEQYAQKIKALEKSLEKVFDTIDCCCGEDE